MPRRVNMGKSVNCPARPSHLESAACVEVLFELPIYGPPEVVLDRHCQVNNLIHLTFHMRFILKESAKCEEKPSFEEKTRFLCTTS